MLIRRILITVCFLYYFCSPAIALNQHVIVYQEEGKFCGWPANEGVWSWGNEIVVGFSLGNYLYNPNGHSYDPNVPLETVQARSLDGGLTWTLERPEAFAASRKLQKEYGRINFTHPDFAMKCRNYKYWYSYDRGRTWSGPFQLPKMDQISLDGRTDYIVNSQCQAFFFIPVAKPDGRNNRSMVFESTNGGGSFEFISYMGPCPPLVKGGNDYCTMPSTVKLSEGVYLSALRQSRDTPVKKRWIDVFKSTDNCKTWEFLSSPVETQGWNPASMIKLADGRICLTYGFRYEPRGIKAKISNDNGQTWGNEIVLRNDGGTWDLGYPRTVQRPDGKIVTIYYYNTNTAVQQHIAATIWEP